MKFTNVSASASTRVGSSALLKLLEELVEATLSFGGTDALCAETGTNGFWDYQDADLQDTVHFTDSRQASSLAKRIRDGELGGIQTLAADGYFDATSISDGKRHGAWAPDYASDEYKANKAGYKDAADKRAFCDAQGIPVRELSGGYVAVRYVTPDSDLWDAEAAEAFAAGTAAEEEAE